MNTQNLKIECEVCGEMLTKAYYPRHLKTKKHLNNEATGKASSLLEDERAVINREGFKRHYRNAKKQMGDEEHRYRVALKKWLQRNPGKSEADYVPRSQRKAGEKRNKPEEDPRFVLCKEVLKDFKIEKVEYVKMPEVRKVVKEKVVQKKLENKLFENKEDLIDLFLTVTKLKPKTINDNVNRVKNIYKRTFNEDWDFRDFEWTRDTDSIFSSVRKIWEGKSEKTISNQFVSLAGLLKYIPSFEKEHKIYSKLGSGIVAILDETAKDNQLSRAQQGKIMTFDQVLQTDLSDENGGTPFHRALFGIYTQIPPRRGLDYRVMKIVRKDKIKKKTKLDRKFNYMFVDKNSKPVKMVIYNYKEGPRRKFAKKNNNSGEYEYVFGESALTKIIHEYIKSENLVANDYLFGLDNNHQQPYGDGSFSQLLSKNIFGVFSKFPMNLNGLRHSFVSWIWDELKTTREKENLAWQMGTSVGELQKTYYKVELIPKKHEPIYPPLD